MKTVRDVIPALLSVAYNGADKAERGSPEQPLSVLVIERPVTIQSPHQKRAEVVPE